MDLLQLATRAQKTTVYNDLVGAYRERAGELNRRFLDGEITRNTWKNAMREEIKTLHVQAYAAGRSGGWDAVTASEWGSVGARLRRQYQFLDRFADDIVSKDMTLAQMNQRAGLYGSASRASFEAAIAAERGLPSNVFPAQPGDGSTICRCIASPWSRVLTRRGWIPIAKVTTDDEVFTHRKRWRRVAAVCRKKSQPDHGLVILHREGFDPIYATDTHVWKTEQGWSNLVGISSSSHLKLHVYGNGIDELQELRVYPRKSQQKGILQTLSVGLLLWTIKGLPGSRVSKLWQEPKGAEAVAGDWIGNAERDSGCRGEAEVQAGGHIRVNELDKKNRWSLVRRLLGWRQKAHDLSVPVAMDSGEWADPAGLSRTPHQPRLYGRSIGEPGGHPGGRTPQDARGHDDGGDAAEARQKVRSLRGHVRLQDISRRQGEVLFSDVLSRIREGIDNVPGLRERILASKGKGAGPKVLLAGVLERQIDLYDIEVEEDHSFVIEGFVSHNSNCKCRWSIRKRSGAHFITWLLGRADHCRTCVRRSRAWKGLKIQGGVMVSPVEPIFD